MEISFLQWLACGAIGSIIYLMSQIATATTLEDCMLLLVVLVLGTIFGPLWLGLIIGSYALRLLAWMVNR